MSLKIIEDAYPTLSECLRPEHMLGFIKGMSLVHLHKDLRADSNQERDRELIKWIERREGFIAGQRAVGEPDGLPVPPVYWTDELGPFDDREELLACMELGSVFSLHSSAEPHMEWVARLPIGEDDVELRTFPTKLAGEQFLQRRHAEIVAAWKEGIAEVKRLYRLGSVDAAEAKMEELGVVDFCATRDDPGHVRIEGERVQVGVDAGKPQVPRTLAPDAV